tara:strand:- start:694 stop:1389 length:696 start_codon:yes stop_codon:yes gene_type:complete
MCGRKTLTKDIASIIHEMDIEECEANNYIPNYNIAPTQFSPILIKHNNKRRIKMMKWGLIPKWSKDLSIGSKMINARIETIMEKPSFNSLIHSNRCIVLVDGYYEWDSTTSQPYYLYHQKKHILPIAGLWTKWQTPNSKSICSYTVITTTPKNNISRIHNRMPVILHKDNIGTWIDSKNNNILTILGKIKKYKPTLKFHPVSKTVNSIKNNSKKCIEPIQIKATINCFTNK